MSDIEFIGLVIRRTDGTTCAFDLSAEDLDLTLSAEMPVELDEDLTGFGRDDRVYLNPPARVKVAIDGKRRPEATKLLVYRIIKDSEPPFPARERAE